MSLKPARQRALAELLRRATVTSQAELRDLLAEEGYEATQATLSRDLVEIGAVKVRAGDGRLVYALPDAGGPPAGLEEVRRALDLAMVSMVPTGNLLVIRTPPGHANVLASALDRARLPAIVGTVAGDDTVLVVCAERTPAKAVARRLQDLIDRRPVRETT
ncbi:MAG TPA: arginine repressor [Acidimicrobiales bacterium]